MMTMSAIPSDSIMVDMIASMNAIGSGAGLKNTERAMSSISSSIAFSWQKNVGSKYRIEKKKKSPFEHVVFSSEKMVHWLEYGLSSFDMKETHTKGPKSRVVKPKTKGGKVVNSWEQTRKDGSKYTVMAGDRYLIIPFRHSAKSLSSVKKSGLIDAYAMVKKQMGDSNFKRSKVTTSPGDSSISTPNAIGEMVKRAEYNWGSKFSFPEEEPFKNLQGLVAMGSKKQSQFMSFRVVSTNSREGSWINPGIKAKHYLKNILEKGQNTIQDVIQEALKRDLSV